MATFNESHQDDGGVVLFSGELILLFCKDVNITITNTNQSEIGRLFLTTHRVIFTSKSMKGTLKSFSAPFYTMHDLSLEQPIFGANYIKGKVNDSRTQNEITFKLKFSKGGAIEYGQALRMAAQATQRMAQNYQPPPPYTPSASQYYEAPPNVYQPAYNCGFALPVDMFNEAPPAGFIYTSDAPPPYPGLSNPASMSNGPTPYPVQPPSSQPMYPSAHADPGVAPPPMPGFNVNVNAPSAPSAPAYPGVGAQPSYPVKN